MLSPQLLALLRLWWKEGKRRGVMLPHGWLFPGRGAVDPVSRRQINRAVQVLLGHSKLDTTALYARVATRRSAR